VRDTRPSVVIAPRGLLVLEQVAREAKLVLDQLHVQLVGLVHDLELQLVVQVSASAAFCKPSSSSCGCTFRSRLAPRASLPRTPRPTGGPPRAAAPGPMAGHARTVNLYL